MGTEDDIHDEVEEYIKFGTINKVHNHKGKACQSRVRPVEGLSGH